MIKVVLVRLQGDDLPDGLRLSIAAELARAFKAHIVGLYINALPSLAVPVDAMSGDGWAHLLATAREAGDVVAASLSARLQTLGTSAELRRFDVFGDDIGPICAREARAADVFLTLRPSSEGETERRDVVEAVLFRGGRHVFLVNDHRTFSAGFDHAVIAWNGSREAARALAEARPYLLKARQASVLAVNKGPAVEIDAMTGNDAVTYLAAHGIEARLRHVKKQKSVSDTIIAEVGALGADLLIMGGYGHSRFAEWLLGGTTRALLDRSPVPLLIAH